jgi:hypothetical protein
MPGLVMDDSVNEEAISKRRSEILAFTAGKQHTVAKNKEFDAFYAFVVSRGDPEKRRASAFEALPSDVLDFMVYRDLTGGGRTVVHKASCMTRESGGLCGCPKRMSADYFRTLASKLRTRFYELGCAGAWSGETCTGNPADSKLVDNAVRAIREEQARAGCMVHSARQRALLPEKLSQLVCFMKNDAQNLAYEKKWPMYVRRLLDIAWLCIQFRSLNRGAELSDLRIGNTVFGPNDCCVVFQFVFGKSMRDGSSHEFAVKALPGDPTCPVAAFRAYVSVSRATLGWDWDALGAYVFPQMNVQNGERLDKPLTPGAYAQRFQAYLGKAGLLEEETLHGLRAGGALDEALRGTSLELIMQKGFWKSPLTAQKYVGLLVAMVGKEFRDEVARRHAGFVQDAEEVLGERPSLLRLA